MQISLNSRCNLELLNLFFAVSNFLKILFVSQDWKFKHGKILIFRLALQSSSDKTHRASFLNRHWVTFYQCSGRWHNSHYLQQYIQPNYHSSPTYTLWHSRKTVNRLHYQMPIYPHQRRPVPEARWREHGVTSWGDFCQLLYDPCWK